MKKFIALIIALIAIVSATQAQRIFKTTDVIGGIPILQLAQKMDVEAFLQTKEIYKTGMTETEFIGALLGNFPKEAETIKPLFIPYYKYIYSFHKRGIKESKIRSEVTGREFATVCTNISSWNANNQGQLVDTKKWTWRDVLRFIKEVIEIILNS